MVIFGKHRSQSSAFIIAIAQFSNSKEKAIANKEGCDLVVYGNTMMFHLKCDRFFYGVIVFLMVRSDLWRDLIFFGVIALLWKEFDGLNRIARSHFLGQWNCDWESDRGCNETPP